MPSDLTSPATTYETAPDIVDDLYGCRRAGARDAELVDALTQQDRGGLDPEQGHALVAELPR